MNFDPVIRFGFPEETDEKLFAPFPPAPEKIIDFPFCAYLSLHINIYIFIRDTPDDLTVGFRFPMDNTVIVPGELVSAGDPRHGPTKGIRNDRPSRHVRRGAGKPPVLISDNLKKKKQ